MSKLRKIVEDLIDEIENEEKDVDEATTTGNVAGYNTPNAFKGTDGTNSNAKNDDDYIDTIIKATGYSRVSENRWHQLKQSEGTPQQKIGVGIRGINKQLSEMEKFIRWYNKIKHENDLKSEDQWKRTQKHLSKIKERLNRIATSISGI